MNNNLTFISTDKTEERYREKLLQGIRSFNDQHSPAHQEIRKSGGLPLEEYALDRQGDLVGGIAGETFWGWFDIDHLWVDERYRDQGIARSLLQRAESKAIERGITRAKLTTFSFQAKVFYEKYGYKVTGEMKDYPPEHSYFWMRKDF